MNALTAINLVSIVVHLVMMYLALFVDKSFLTEGYTAYVMAVYGFSIAIIALLTKSGERDLI